jgi:hypothetical protein
MILNSAWRALGHIHNTTAWSKRMRVELFPPESVTEPRRWVRHDQAFAMMLGPGSIEWGSLRSAMEKFDYAAGDLALCDRHQGEWVGLMNTPHLQISISDAALMTASDGANGEVELRPQRQFADPRLGALVAAVRTEMVAGFPSGQLFVDSVEQAMAVALVNGHAVTNRPVQITSGRDEPARRRRSPVPAATGPHAEPRGASAAGRTERIPSLMGRPKRWTCPISRSNNASTIARQWSIRETWLMLGWSTPTGHRRGRGHLRGHLA